METVGYSIQEKISLIKNNDFVTRESKVSSREGRGGVSVSRSSFAYRLGKKYSVNDAFDIVVKDLLLNMNPAGGGSGFYSGSASIDITGKIISVIPGGISHDSIADVSANDHHNEAHALATLGNPHTGTLPLTDLDVGTAGDIITRQVADWAVLAKGTQNHVLKMGATYPGWGLAPVTQHAIDSGTYHTSTDITTLNATTSKHGFLKKLGGGTTNFLRADGAWAAPPGSGYPSAGIALSTGSAWGTSITNNSSQWNAAYDHSQDDSQAHADYLRNNVSDSMGANTLIAGDFILHD